MASVWDSLGGMERMVLGSYGNIAGFLKRLPDKGEDDPAANSIKDKLKGRLTRGGFDSAYAAELNGILGDKETCDRLIKISEEKPGELGAVVETAVSDPKGLQSAVRQVRLESDPPAPAADAPPVVAAATPAPAPAKQEPAAAATPVYDEEQQLCRAPDAAPAAKTKVGQDFAQSAPREAPPAPAAPAVAAATPAPAAAAAATTGSTASAGADTASASASSPLEMLSGSMGGFLNNPAIMIIVALAAWMFKGFGGGGDEPSNESSPNPLQSLLGSFLGPK